jgi:hypothetical protein
MSYRNNPKFILPQSYTKPEFSNPNYLISAFNPKGCHVIMLINPGAGLHPKQYPANQHDYKTVLKYFYAKYIVRVFNKWRESLVFS